LRASIVRPAFHPKSLQPSATDVRDGQDRVVAAERFVRIAALVGEEVRAGRERWRAWMRSPETGGGRGAVDDGADTDRRWRKSSVLLFVLNPLQIASRARRTDALSLRLKQ